MNDEPTKVCSRTDCPHKGAPQPLANFTSMGRRRRPNCKTCDSRMRLAWREANRDRDRESNNRNRKKRDTPDGVTRSTAYTRKWRAKNAERFRAYESEYRRRYRARKRAAKEQTT
jgi:hypothetical protein